MRFLAPSAARNGDAGKTGITPHSSPVVSYPRASIRLRNDFLVLSAILYFVIKVPKLECLCPLNRRVKRIRAK